MNKGFIEKLIDRIQRVQPGDMQSYLIDLAREKGFLETIFNTILEGVIVTDPNGRILYMNRSACGFFALNPDTSTGKFLGDVVRGFDWEELGAGREVVSREMEVFYPENRLLNFYAVTLPGEDATGNQPVGCAVILRDVTESRRSKKEEIESERLSALTLLSAGVAHEIGNPLNSLGLQLQLMERKIKKLPAKSRQSLEDSVSISRQEVARLDTIITQFLRAVRPQPAVLEPGDINQILEEALQFLAPEIRDRDILLEKSFDPSPPSLHLDRDQIKQAFYNVLKNGFQAMKTGGILRVETRHDEARVLVSFQDSGGGISPDQISRIFDPYFTTKPGGTGLGLMIVQRIVRAHGGGRCDS